MFENRKSVAATAIVATIALGALTGPFIFRRRADPNILKDPLIQKLQISKRSDLTSDELLILTLARDDISRLLKDEDPLHADGKQRLKDGGTTLYRYPHTSNDFTDISGVEYTLANLKRSHIYSEVDPYGLPKGDTPRKVGKIRGVRLSLRKGNLKDVHFIFDYRLETKGASYILPQNFLEKIQKERDKEH